MFICMTMDAIILEVLKLLEMIILIFSWSILYDFIQSVSLGASPVVALDALMK